MVLPPQGPHSSAAPRPVYAPSAEEPSAVAGGDAGIRRPNLPPLARPRVVFPAVTVFLLIANTAVLGLMVANGVSLMSPDPYALVDWGSNFGPRTLHGEWWRLITSCFLHGGAIHLAFNMYVLWDLGRMTERTYGSPGFALVYLVAGIGGSFASVMLNPQVNSVGASGAVFGVAGAFLAFLLRNRKKIEPSISQNLRRSLLTFLLINLAIGFSIPGIDQAAHVGGLVTGFISGIVVAPDVSKDGPVRHYVRYPLVVLLGAAMCVAAWLGLSLRMA